MNARRFIAVSAMSVGFGMAVAGCYAFIFALKLGNDWRVIVTGLGPLNGRWGTSQYCFLGAVLSAVGSGLFVLGLTGIVLMPRGSDASWWRRLILPVFVTAVVGGLGLAGSVFLPKQQGVPRPTEEERNKARQLAFRYLDSGEKALLTEDFARRLGGQDEQVSYQGTASLKDWVLQADEVVVLGHLKVTCKTVVRTSAQGGMMSTIDYKEPKWVDVLVRVVKTDGGNWLIDDVRFTER